MNVFYLKVFDILKGIDVIYEIGYNYGDYYYEGGIEFYIWNFVCNVLVIVCNIYFVLSELDSVNEFYFKYWLDSL